MFRLRFFTDATARTKNGQPAHSTTGVPSSSCIQFDSLLAQQVVQVRSGGRPSPAQRPARSAPVPIQKRFVMSRSSGLSPVLGGRQHRLERHAADGAVARPHLAHLRVHRAGVLDLALVAPGRASAAGVRLTWRVRGRGRGARPSSPCRRASRGCPRPMVRDASDRGSCCCGRAWRSPVLAGSFDLPPVGRSRARYRASGAR